MVIDPPFNNTGCKLPYGLLDDYEWMDAISFDGLMADGLIFFWVTNAKGGTVERFMTQRGWALKEQVEWIKVNTYNQLHHRGGYYLRHVRETCQVYKRAKPRMKDREYLNPGLAPNAIIAPIRGIASTKPVQLYEIVEALVPHGPYIELFGRVNNQREGWLTVGNEAVEYQSKEDQQAYHA
jgi:N6-adenosine-specific RNA methylase IME4